MLSVQEKIIKQARLEFPNGRAFWVPQGSGDRYVTPDGDPYVSSSGDAYYITSGSGGVLFDVLTGLSYSIEQLFTDSVNSLNHQIPDNSIFDEDDATLWERAIGLSGGGTLAERKDAIIQRLRYPGNQRYRQHAAFIQEQLQTAGFDVYVYENRFLVSGSYITRTPSEILGYPVGRAVHGNFNHGELNHGSLLPFSGVTLCVDYIEEEKDDLFIVGDNWRSTFFIAGATITDFADVPLARKDEFRQLIITLKQAQLAAFLFVNYI